MGGAGAWESIDAVATSDPRALQKRVGANPPPLTAQATTAAAAVKTAVKTVVKTAVKTVVKSDVKTDVKTDVKESLGTAQRATSGDRVTMYSTLDSLGLASFWPAFEAAGETDAAALALLGAEAGPRLAAMGLKVGQRQRVLTALLRG